MGYFTSKGVYRLMKSASNQTIAFIIAREKSRGLKLKNLQTVGGVSLVGRAIVAAKKSNVVDRIIVSTESAKIAKETKRYSNIELITRPASLAQDSSKVIDTALYCINQIGITTGTSILLQPTSPLREGKDISDALDLFRKYSSGSVVSVYSSPHHPYKTLLNNSGKLMPIHSWEDLETSRQDLPQTLQLNGAIYINSISDLIKNKSFLTKPIYPYLMDGIKSIDVDSVFELEMANYFWEKLHG